MKIGWRPLKFETFSTFATTFATTFAITIIGDIRSSIGY